MANTKVTGDLIASGTITADNLVSGTLDTLLNSYLTTNTYATQGYVTTAVNNLIDAAPASLDTLNELAAALNDDANFATTVTNSLATKLNLSGGTLTGALSFQDTSIPSAGTASIFSRNTNSYLYLQTGSGNQIQLLDGSQNTMAIFNPSLVSFSISNSEVMRIDSSGRVGIGLVPTVANLEVDTNLYVKHPNAEELTFRVDNYGTTGTDAGAILRLYNQTGVEGVRLDPRSGSTRHSFIVSGGNFGIGTTSPTGKLNVQQSSLNTAALFIGRYNAEDSPIIQIGESTSFSGTGAYGEALIASRNRDIVFSTGDFQSLSSVNTAALIIEKGEGNVGIGTTSPSAKLHVNGGTGNNTAKVIIGGNDAIIRLGNNNGGGPHGLQFDYESGVATDGMSIYYRTGPEQITFEDSTGTGGSKVMVVGRNGNVGIGTTSPNALLEISKNAGADPAPVDGPVTLRLTDAGNAATGSGDTTNPWAEIQFYSEDASSGGPAVQAKIATIYDDIYSAGSHIAFYNTATPTNGLTENVRITSIGRVGIGTTSPDYRLVVSGAGTERVRVGSTNNTTAGVYFTVKSGGSLVGNGTIATQNNGDMRFFTGTNGESEKMRLLAGGGLTFNGDTAAANALDDYEEGTFTPTIFGSSSSGTTTYTQQNGKYTKIGNVVYITGGLIWTSATGTGSLLIGGLPFTVGNYSPYSNVTVLTKIISYTHNNVNMLPQSATTRAYLFSYGSGQSSAIDVSMQGSGTIEFSGFYMI